MRILLLGFIVSAIAFACGSSTNPPPKCNGASCSCTAGAACDIPAGTCDQSCSLDCGSMNLCNGECGTSCSLKCTGGSTCSMTVGNSGSVDCSGGSTCHINCTGSCSLNCGGGSTCDLQCPSDSAPKPVTGASAGCG